MLDPDTPPVAEEGEADGVVGVVHQIIVAVAQAAATASSQAAAFTAPQWTTVIGLLWAAETTGLVAEVAPALPLLIPRLSPSRSRIAMTPIHASLPSLMIFSSRPRFKKPRVNSTSRLSSSRLKRTSATRSNRMAKKSLR